MNDIGLEGKGGYSVGHGRGHAADRDGDGHGYGDGYGQHPHRSSYVLFNAGVIA